MTAYQWILDELAPAFCRTLLHSLWLGLIAAVLAGLVMIMTRKQAASLRYQLLLLVFALLVVSTVTSFFIELQMPAKQETNAVGNPDSISVINTEIETINLVADKQPVLSTILTFLDKHALTIFSAWFVFFLFHAARMFMGLKHINRIRYTRTSTVDRKWNDWLIGKCQELGIQQKVRFLQSELVSIPVAIGYLKPMILVPVGLLTQLNASQVESILLHELAHIKRKDYVVNLIQTTIDAIFFFNPAFTWISFLIRQERENSCDDIVLNQSENQAAYLEALLSFQSKNHIKTYAMALGTRKHSLLNRVKRMLTRENSTLTVKEFIMLSSGLFFAGLCLMAFHPAEPLASVAGKNASPVKRIEFATTSTMTRFINLPIVKTSQLTNRLPQPKCDTVPRKEKVITEVKPRSEYRFKEINSNIVDDGTNSIHQIQAIGTDGTIYKIRKIQNEVVSFTINGNEVSKDEYAIRLNDVTEAIEDQRRRKEVEKNKKIEQQKKFALKNKEVALANRKAALVNREVKLKHEKNIKRDSVRKLQSLKQIERGKVKLAHLNKPIRLSKSPQLESIIHDIIKSGLAADETKLSFSLNNGQFIVNGVVQPDSVFQKFRSAYLKSPGDRYNYTRDGNSTKTEIQIN